MIRGWGVQLAELLNHIRRGTVQATLKEGRNSLPELAGGEEGQSATNSGSRGGRWGGSVGEGTWVGDEVAAREADEELWRGASDDKGGGLESLSLKSRRQRRRPPTRGGSRAPGRARRTGTRSERWERLEVR